MKIVQLSEEDFYQWIKIQLEKRGNMIGRCYEKEKIKEALYEILFYEQELTIEDIEYYFIPFGQAGYLTPKQKFEIILYVLEKEHGGGRIFFEEISHFCIVTGEEIDRMYLQWQQEERLFLTEEEKLDFFVQNIMDNLGLGVLEVLKRVALDGILLGEMCPAYYEQERVEERVAVFSKGVIIYLPFLALKSKEELIRIIKKLVVMENKRELTVIDPVLDFVQEDGTYITAVRPPAGHDWGIRILYGAARKELLEWKN